MRDLKLKIVKSTITDSEFDPALSVNGVTGRISVRVKVL